MGALSMESSMDKLHCLLYFVCIRCTNCLSFSQRPSCTSNRGRKRLKVEMRMCRRPHLHRAEGGFAVNVLNEGCPETGTLQNRSCPQPVAINNTITTNTLRNSLCPQTQPITNTVTTDIVTLTNAHSINNASTTTTATVTTPTP